MKKSLFVKSIRGEATLYVVEAGHKYFFVEKIGFLPIHHPHYKESYLTKEEALIQKDRDKRKLNNDYAKYFWNNEAL